MIKSAICVAASVLLLVINTAIMCLKPEYTYAKNDKENYSIYYQKWIKTIMFMGTIIVALFAIYFALNMKLYLAFCLLSIECLVVVIYSVVKYKCITINGNNITIERLFRHKKTITYEDIIKVTYIPNAKIELKLKKKDHFEISFNSENFHRFYLSLVLKDIKFKTGHVPSDENHVILSRYKMTINFPKTMFREYYQSKTYLRNSNYLFSARSLENKEYIEGYSKESELPREEFIDIIKNDLQINNFQVGKTYKETIDTFEFDMIDAIYNEDKNYGRTALIYKDTNSYFILYTNYLLDKKEDFHAKLKYLIHKTSFEDSKTRMTKI